MTQEFVISGNFQTERLGLGLPGITGGSVQDTWHGTLGPNWSPIPPGTTGCSGCSFSFPGRSHFPSHRSGPPGPGNRVGRRVPIVPHYIPFGTRRQIPVGPRSAKSAQRDGKLQQYWPLGPPPAPSRNSRPWTLAPQLIHSRGAGPPPHARTDVRTRAPEAEDRTGSGAGRQAGEYGTYAPSADHPLPQTGRALSFGVPQPLLCPALVLPPLSPGPQDVCQTSAAHLMGNSKRLDALSVKFRPALRFTTSWPLTPVVGKTLAKLGFQFGPV